jgi:hypothetical protein
MSNAVIDCAIRQKFSNNLDNTWYKRSFNKSVKKHFTCCRDEPRTFVARVWYRTGTSHTQAQLLRHVGWLLLSHIIYLCFEIQILLTHTEQQTRHHNSQSPTPRTTIFKYNYIMHLHARSIKSVFSMELGLVILGCWFLPVHVALELWLKKSQRPTWMLLIKWIDDLSPGNHRCWGLPHVRHVWISTTWWLIFIGGWCPSGAEFLPDAWRSLCLMPDAPALSNASYNL